MTKGTHMRRLCLFLAALIFPALAFAADGDSIRVYGSGAYCVKEVLLCDGDHVDGVDVPGNGCPDTSIANSTDLRWDLQLGTVSTDTVATAGAGLPLFFVVEVRADNGAVTKTKVDIFGYDESDGTGTHQLNATVLEAGTAVTSLTVDPTTHRYINVEIDTEGDGTDLDVVLRAFTPKKYGVKCPGAS